MFFGSIFKLTYKILILSSFKLYLLSNVLLFRTRLISRFINKIANKIYKRNNYLSATNYSKITNKIISDFNENFEANIISDPKEYELRFITPLFPYIICDHFLSLERDKNRSCFMFTDIKIKGNDLLKDNFIHNIKNFDIVLVQCDFFDFFHDTILPYLERNNIKIILITCQFHFPSLKRSFLTDNCINHPSIILWISQNPIYYNKPNYFPIPYGLDHRNLEVYISYIKKYGKQIVNKRKSIINLYSNAHPGHLSRNHFRTKYKNFLCDERKKLSYDDYVKEISNSKFLISPTGDREDCFRHYEAIGLGAIPISDAPKNLYKDIFGRNMIFLKEKRIISIINSSSDDFDYYFPDSEILLNSYCINKINEKINSIIRNYL